MQHLLGLPLEDALARLKEQGLEASVVETSAPRGRADGTLRVIRVSGTVLTVSRFRDGAPSNE